MDIGTEDGGRINVLLPGNTGPRAIIGEGCAVPRNIPDLFVEQSTREARAKLGR